MTVKVGVTFNPDKPINWRTRALLAEAELATVRTALETATKHHAGIELRFAERAALVSIAREGRKINFTFLRNGQIYRVTAMGTWDDDVDAWKKALLEPIEKGGSS